MAQPIVILMQFVMKMHRTLAKLLLQFTQRAKLLVHSFRPTKYRLSVTRFPVLRWTAASAVS